MNTMTTKLTASSRKKLDKLTSLIAEATQVELGALIQLCRRQMARNNSDAELLSNFTGDLDLAAEPSDDATKG